MRHHIWRVSLIGKAVDLKSTEVKLLQVRVLYSPYSIYEQFHNLYDLKVAVGRLKHRHFTHTQE